jgi:GAF domain-containing protein
VPHGNTPPPPGREAALHNVVTAAANNIRGVDFASVSLRAKDRTLCTLASTDPLADKIDALQYELREGPCYAAVTGDRLIMVNDLEAESGFPRYGPKAADLGVGSQVAIQLFHDGEQAGLNLYARKVQAFDRSTVELAELFATQAAALLEYAEQVEQLSEALHTRTDIGTAVGILMERYTIDRNRAFSLLVRNSNNRNVKLRVLAQDVIGGTFESTPHEDSRMQEWP